MFNKKPSSNTERRMVPLRYVLTPFAIIFAAIILLIIVSALAPKPEKKPIVHKAPLVEVESLKKESVTFVIPSQGNILPRTETNLIAEVSGKVVSVSEKFKVGGYFLKGEQLLALDDVDYKIALIQAQANLANAKANLVEQKARAEQAEAEWLLSGESLDNAPVLALRIPNLQKAEADLKAAQANLQSAEIKLARTKITAPYDAMLQEKHVDIGQFVSMGTTIAKTFAIDYAEVRLPIKQRDVSFLNLPKINQEQAKTALVDIQFDLDGKVTHWPAKITRYEGVVDSKSRVHYIVAQIDDPYALLSNNPHQEIRMGAFIHADIQGKTVEGVLSIPRDALHGADTIYTLDTTNKLHIQKIELLRTDASFVYSLNDLPTGHRLITTMLEMPVEGMSLRVAGEQKNNNEDALKETVPQENTEVIGES
ncbi:efflux RND transporter periplasmic adaptor subunit [Colwellia sp. 1_MG-2023]|uniref:efflux RND transporter periplasmic adaptor subunit n=1 Tax=Colwellia sp. 1_MG-2023 TaxID=3062649 RepID=UPI0026E2B1B6|nr:efflux RND transporter periplasmic adaptor subunit [Colwellia sp. 1_MG-2023]MDO6444627.1 efflux RND transporter periplasmic adaptor subunit [Colwellia sp. 1_MG-2023]